MVIDGLDGWVIANARDEKAWDEYVQLRDAALAAAEALAYEAAAKIARRHLEAHGVAGAMPNRHRHETALEIEQEILGLRAAAPVLLGPLQAENERLRGVLREIASKKSLLVPRLWQMAEEAIRG